MYNILNVSLIIMLLPFLVVLLGLGMMTSHVESAESNTTLSEPRVVKDVDLSRYLGRWYEIALIPVWFQKGCAGGTTAKYTLVKDGVVSVVNKCCTKDGKVKEAKGRAWVVDKKTPAKLKASSISPSDVAPSPKYTSTADGWRRSFMAQAIPTRNLPKGSCLPKSWLSKS